MKNAPLVAAIFFAAINSVHATPEEHDRMLDVAKGGGGIYANELKIEIVGTPIFTAQSIPPMAPKAPRPMTPEDPQPRWVQIETTFDCSIPFSELTLKYHALLLVNEDPDRERKMRGEQVAGQKPPVKKYKLILRKRWNLHQTAESGLRGKSTFDRLRLRFQRSGHL